MVKGRGTYPQACVSILENSISRLPTLRCCGIRGTEIAFWFGSLIQRLSRPARRLFCCQVLGGRITPVDVTFGLRRPGRRRQQAIPIAHRKKLGKSGGYHRHFSFDRRKIPLVDVAVLLISSAVRGQNHSWLRRGSYPTSGLQRHYVVTSRRLDGAGRGQPLPGSGDSGSVFIARGCENHAVLFTS